MSLIRLCACVCVFERVHFSKYELNVFSLSLLDKCVLLGCLQVDRALLRDTVT